MDSSFFPLSGPDAVNYEAIGKNFFNTENILGVNKNLDTISRIGETVSSTGSSNVPAARPVGAEEMSVREELQKLGEQLNTLKNNDIPPVETIADKMRVAEKTIRQAVTDFNRLN